MKKTYIILLLVAAALNPVQGFSQTEEEMMKAWEAYATPGDAHKMMANEVGAWSNEMTFWDGPAAQPAKAASDCEVRMILGGRYQDMTYKGIIMGMDFEGRGTLAYNNTTKEYTSTWLDNMGTGMMVMKGKMKPGAKSLELYGEMTDPMTGKAVKCREVYTVVDANTRKMEMFDTKDGKEYKSMEILMKRR